MKRLHVYKTAPRSAMSLLKKSFHITSIAVPTKKNQQHMIALFHETFFCVKEKRKQKQHWFLRNPEKKNHAQPFFFEGRNPLN